MTYHFVSELLQPDSVYKSYQGKLFNNEFAICHIARNGNVNSIQNPVSVTNPTMEP